MGLLNIIRRMALREKLPIREIARRTGLSRNTIKRYLNAGTVEPKFAAPDRPSKLDPFSGKLAGWLKTERLARWLDGMETACLTAMRHLDDIEAWSARAETLLTPLSGKTPPALRAVLTEWPLVSAPMAEALTRASRAAVQRNLTWMEAHGLIREMTGQGRFRVWRAVN